jgi:hypothetical protein
MGTIARSVEMPVSPPGAPGLFRCAPAGFMRSTFSEAGLRDVSEEEVETEMVHGFPERYWEFMTEIAAPVVAGLASADEAARVRIRNTVLGLSHGAVREARVRMRSTATVIVGTR